MSEPYLLIVLTVKVWSVDASPPVAGCAGRRGGAATWGFTGQYASLSAHSLVSILYYPPPTCECLYRREGWGCYTEIHWSVCFLICPLTG